MESPRTAPLSSSVSSRIIVTAWSEVTSPNLSSVYTLARLPCRVMETLPSTWAGLSSSSPLPVAKMVGQADWGPPDTVITTSPITSAPSLPPARISPITSLLSSTVIVTPPVMVESPVPPPQTVSSEIRLFSLIWIKMSPVTSLSYPPP